MRNLTIKREKSFVGSLGTMKVYIEDAFRSDITINGIPCRKLGELKNGAEQTFTIDTNAAKVFVIGDKVSRGFSNDYYPLPAGEEDVFLSGKNHYNPGAGNPFRFDGVTDEAVLANRKKGNRTGIIILVAALLVGFLAGLAGPFLSNLWSSNPKEFSAEGMTITLTAAFDEAEYAGFTQCYESNEVAIMALKEKFTLLPGAEDYSVEEYGQLVLQGNSMKDTALKTKDGVVYFTYTSEVADGSTYFYFAAVYKGSDAFWLIQFAAPESLRDTYEPQFLQWAGSVTVE